jgi:amino-acid N-acetyltransferase
MSEEFRVRTVTVTDVMPIFRLVNHYANLSQMLPKSQNQIYQNLRDFRVVVDRNNQIVACGALHILWADLAEVRSVAVVEEHQGKGLGRMLVTELIEDARQLGLPTVFALTYVPGFFESLGFRIIDKNQLPHKIWGDCIDCPKFPNCDEVAVLKELQNDGR